MNGQISTAFYSSVHHDTAAQNAGEKQGEAQEAIWGDDVSQA